MGCEGCAFPFSGRQLNSQSTNSPRTFVCRVHHAQESMLQELIDVKGATVGVASRAAAAMTGMSFDDSHKACLAMKKLKVKLKFGKLRTQVKMVAQRLLARAKQM